jgi:hypothetical protein
MFVMMAVFCGRAFASTKKYKAPQFFPLLSMAISVTVP